MRALGTSTADLDIVLKDSDGAGQVEKALDVYAVTEQVDIDLQNLSASLKRRYFSRLAMKHIGAMRMNYHGGQLWIDRDDAKWKGGRGTVEHSLAQVPAIIELARLCGFDEDACNRLATHAAVHNWDKNFDLALQELEAAAMPPREKNEARNAITGKRGDIFAEYAKRLQLDEKLIAATTPAIHERFADSTFEERMMFYIDDCFMGSEFVDPMERITEVERRRQDLGREYWPREKKMIADTECEIFNRMTEHAQKSGKPLPIERADQVPEFVRKRVARTILQEQLLSQD